MATFIQNIRKIRGEAIYGPEMRTAIADAIEQAISLDIGGEVGVVLLSVDPIPETDDDYELSLYH